MNRKITKVLSWRIYILTIAALTITQFALAQQNKVTIYLTDEETKAPISFAHYIINQQKGVSAEDGSIEFQYSSGTTLHISHILYGHKTYSEKALEQIVNSGKLSLIQSDIEMQPAVVMGLHSQKLPDEQLVINYHDMLSHDAGAYLGQNPAVSSIKKSGTYGFDPVFRGYKYDQLNIIIDGGQSAMAACPNRMDPPASQVSLNMMNHVEILKGPHSLRYGNSYGGTFHFKSPKPEYASEFSPFGRITGSYESNGAVYRTESMLGARNKWSNFKLFGSYSAGSDYKDGSNNEVPATFKRTSVGTNIDFRLTKNQDLTVSTTNNVAKDVDFPSLPMDLRSDNTLLLNLRHSARIQNKSVSAINTMLFGTWVDHKMDNLSKEMNPRTVNAITKAETKTYGGRTEAKFNINKGWAYLGADIRINEQDGERTREMLTGMMAGNIITDNVWQDGIMQQIGVFGEVHWSTAGNHLVAALRLDDNRSEIRDPDPLFIAETNDSSQHFTNLSASLGLTRKLSGNTSLGLWFGRARRSGGLTELYINYFPVGLDAYEMVGNPQLKPEENNQTDLNFKWEPSNAVIDVNLFYSYLNNYISSVIIDTVPRRMMKAPGVRQFTNISKAFKTGFEISWIQKLPAHLSTNVALAYIYAEDINTGQALPEIPPLDLRIGLLGSYLDEKLRAEIIYRYALEQDRINTAFRETVTPSFSMLDLKLSYQWGKYVYLLTGVNNLLNETYYEHLSRVMKINNGSPLYAPGRSFYATVSVKF
jgi:iron complex outermembrane receptor protein